MGKLHSRVYSQMPQVRLAGVFDVNRAGADAVAQTYNCRAFATIEEMLSEVKAVTIATPTEFHAEMAEPCLRRGVACLIEKPLARNSEECQKIVDWARAGGAVLQVGHVERFNPVMRAVTKLGLKPRFMETVRVSPLTFRSLDVGVVLDMMIHDLDIVLHLAGARVKKVEASGVSVLGLVEDVANARLTFENGCVASVAGSRLALKTERKLRIVTADAYVSVDYAKKEGVIARRSPNLEAIRDVARKVKAGEVADLAQVNFASLVKLEPLTVDQVEPLRAEQDAFLDAIINRTRPVVSGEDGAAAVEVAERIVQAMGSAELD
jgi:predicted dehydrogenase